MLRAATFADLARLHALVVEMHGKSEFAARGIALDHSLTKAHLVNAVRRHGSSFAGSTLLNVIEKNGQVEAFMLGLLQPIYAVCSGTEAQDFWLYATPKAPKLSVPLLIDGYVEWAEKAGAKDIVLSWTNVVGIDGQKIGQLYRRKGFERVGEIYKRGTTR